ncbi:hypothetical protein CVS40_5640 [Lucilia cuprina]|nr:hypothetical protein CVS40_5640 [Lucilia cuprina]
MFSNYYCRCCLTKTGVLLTLNSQSSHMDGKTLLEYFNLVFTSYALGHEAATEYICLRCSKALQVSYHFINMVKAAKSSSVPLEVEQEGGATFLGNVTSKENQQHTKQETVVRIA